MRIRYAAIPLLAAATLASCGADPQYKSPEAAAQTYVENGPLLAKAIDLAAWNFVWNGMSKSRQKWFEENWEKICDRPDYRAACGEQSPERAKMVAFGAAVSGRGPLRGAAIKEVKKLGSSADVTFEGWDGTMHLVKEERGNWKLDELFGVEKEDPKNW
ncbi:MAG: hypothetical protein U0166_21285 [Acidobacteriota bacterium]